MVDTPPLPRRERERLRHRQEILDAARKVLADKGLEGVTVEQVAREAEFAVGSIYRHFSSKEQLIEELLVDLAEAFFDDLEDLAAQNLSFEDHLHAYVRMAYQGRVESEPFFRALFAAPGGLPAPGSAAGQRLLEVGFRYMGYLDHIMAKGQAEGVLAEGDRTLLLVSLPGLITSLSHWNMFSGRPLDEDGPARLVSLFLNGARGRGEK